MAAKYILAIVAVIFFAAVFMRITRDGRIAHPQTRVWLLIGIIFSVVSAWLFYQS